MKRKLGAKNRLAPTRQASYTKGKKSKAELEAERIEEERLAEERRVAEEKAEAERLERERIAAEKLKAEQKAYREEELQRLQDELRDEEGNLPRRRSKINALREEAETDRNWTHFRNCVQVPTGDDALAVNGYLARLEQDMNEEKIRHEFAGRLRSIILYQGLRKLRVLREV